jgi:hypothetical protein
MSEQSNQDRRTRSKSITIQVEQRRKKVAELLSIGMSESAIARQLDKARSTINEDVSALKAQATEFVYSLAKDNLAHMYKQTIDDITRAKAAAWDIFNKYSQQEQEVSPIARFSLNSSSKHHSQNKDKLNALRIIIQANATIFELLSSSPTIMSVRALSERLERLEQQKATPIQQQEVSVS